MSTATYLVLCTSIRNYNSARGYTWDIALNAQNKVLKRTENIQTTSCTLYKESVRVWWYCQSVLEPKLKMWTCNQGCWCEELFMIKWFSFLFLFLFFQLFFMLHALTCCSESDICCCPAHKPPPFSSNAILSICIFLMKICIWMICFWINMRNV